MELAQRIRKDKYEPEVTIGTDLPMVWLKSIDDEAVKDALKGVVAGANINGKLRPTEFPNHVYQQFTTFLVELVSEAQAEALLRIAHLKRARGGEVAIVAIKKGRLFCLLIARCCMDGGQAFETQESLMRFERAFSEVLQRFG
jgi:hypothetical protein